MTFEKDKNRMNSPAGRFACRVSLGWFCGTASAMDRHGLRFSSGPFDWYFSDLPGVLQTIDEDFAHYLQIGHLQTVAEKPTEFQDIKYGFYYNHDVKENLEKEYEEIRAKYLRRIARFSKAIRQPTCFDTAPMDLRARDRLPVRDRNVPLYRQRNQRPSLLFGYTNPRGFAILKAVVKRMHFKSNQAKGSGIYEIYSKKKSRRLSGTSGARLQHHRAAVGRKNYRKGACRSDGGRLSADDHAQQRSAGQYDP